MSVFYSILSALDGTMETPKPYGWFHLMCLGIVLIFSILVIIFRKKFRNCSKRSIKFRTRN